MTVLQCFLRCCNRFNPRRRIDFKNFIRLSQVFVLIGLFGNSAVAEPQHGIAMHGEPALTDGAQHLPYANPDAPKGGRLAEGIVGTFDNLNPFNIKGVTPVDARNQHVVRELVYESLMRRSRDEPFTLYGLLARAIEVPADRSRVTFRLRPEARFSDGGPVTIDDVVFSLETLRDQGRPYHRAYYKRVRAIERPAPDTITFVLDSDPPDRELPLILGLMPILSRNDFAGRRFEETSLAPPVGSGPYRVAEVEAGRTLVLKRNPDYWGRALWLNRGFFNFDEIRYDYYRDENVALSALLTGLGDLWLETDPARWAKAYDVPAVRNGTVKKFALTHHRPAAMYGFVFNTRRSLFSDVRVRRALTLVFDFESINRALLYGAYARTESFFHGSELAATGPASAEERALLAPFPDAVSTDILESGWHAPTGGSPAANRSNRRAALSLLAEAGFHVEKGKLVSSETGAAFRFEIMIGNADEERIALGYADALSGLGIEATVRSVDASQYEQRIGDHDFDMTPFRWDPTLSPGNEQFLRWGSAAASTKGSLNIAGVRSPAIDAAIEALIAAKTRHDLVTAAHVLDRLLLSGAYLVPLFHTPADRIAVRATLAFPDRTSIWGFEPMTWWQSAPSE